jgi:hypothetical protein
MHMQINFIKLLYAEDTVLMARSPHDLKNQVRILKDFCSNMGMTINTDERS